jgi:YVTN family beta-propeller protein
MRTRILPSAARALVCLIISFLFLGGDSSPAAAQLPGPGAVAVSPDGRRVYVADTARSGVDVIDAATNQLVTTIPLRGGPFQLGLAVSPDRSHLYVTDLGKLNVISTTLGKVVATVKVGKQPIGVAVSPDGERIYVTNENDNTVSVIDASSDQVIATVRVGSNPQGLAVRPDGQRIYVVDRGFNASSNGRSALNGAISVIDAATNKVHDTVWVHTAPWAVTVSPDGRRVYVTHVDPASSQVDIINTANDQLVSNAGEIPGGFSEAAAVSPDSQRLYVLPDPWNVVAAIDLTNRLVVGAVGVGQGPIALAVSPDGRRVYVSNGASQTLSVIDAASLQGIATIDLHTPR